MRLNLKELRNIIKEVIVEEQQKGTRQDALNYLSDLYKEINGFRPNLSQYKDSSDEQLWQEIQNLEKESENQAQEEEKEEQLNAEKFEQSVEKIIQSGAGDRATALRWMFNAEDYYGIDGFLYHYGLSIYTPKGREIEKELDAALSADSPKELNEMRKLIRKMIKS